MLGPEKKEKQKNNRVGKQTQYGIHVGEIINKVTFSNVYQNVG
jgi:hypothetical protein